MTRRRGTNEDARHQVLTPNRSTMTRYDTLEVAPSANETLIRAAYRVLASKHRPDKVTDASEAAHRLMQTVNDAYEVLSDPIRC